GLAARTRPAELSREVRPRVTVAQALECPMPFGTDGGVDPRGSARSELRSDGKLKHAPPMRRRRTTPGGSARGPPRTRLELSHATDLLHNETVVNCQTHSIGDVRHLC